MATMSSDLDEGSRPRLNLLDLPQEIKDQIYGYLVSDTYLIVPSLEPRRGSLGRRRPLYNYENQGDDFRHLSILRVSKRANCEAMELLKRRSWFIYRMPDLRCGCNARDNDFSPCLLYCCYCFDNATTRHMMNIQIVIDHFSLRRDWRSVFRSFAGTEILRRTCLIQVPNSSLLLVSQDYGLRDELRRHLQHIKLLTGFETVVVQVNLIRNKHRRRDEIASDEYCTKLLMDMIEDVEPAVGPAMPCDPVQGEDYDLNFKFSPIQFAAEQRQLESLKPDTGA